MTSPTKNACALMLLMLSAVSPAAADVVDVSSIQFVGSAIEFFTDENRLIDGSGLSQTILTEADFLTATTGNASQATAWVTNAPNGGLGDFFAGAPADAVVFDIGLAETYEIDSFASWGYHFGAAQGNYISAMTMEFSTDGGLNFDSSQSIIVPMTVAASAVTAITAVNANFIRMTITDNHFDGPGGIVGGDRAGMSEFRFGGSVVPEASSIVVGIFLALASLLYRFQRSEIGCETPTPHSTVGA